MLIIIVVGLGSAANIQRKIMPTFEFEIIWISVPYPGAAPEEVERGIVEKIEEAINDIEGIDRIEADALESVARIMIEPVDGVDISKLYNDVQNRIDGITTFPANAEEPIITQPEVMFPVLNIQISGNLDLRSMKALAQEMRRDLLTYPEVSAADIIGDRAYEISVEISEPLLREYHLTLQDVARTIAASSLDLPAGSLRTRNGEIMLRTVGQAYQQQAFEQLVLRTWPDGTRLLLGDIATVRDDFVEERGFSEFDGRPSLGLQINSMGEQDIIETAAIVKDYLAQKRAELPDGVNLEVWGDFTYYLDERLDTMVRNLAIGALLVFITLALFLEIKLAFWVMLGIPVCFLGAMAAINTPYIHASLNMVSIFGFILVLGIVVDDAIIIGESAYSETEAHGHSLDSVIRGAYRVATPATFGVLTTIVAFAPTLFVQGMFAPMPAAAGWVVILCLTFSLVESKWILPSHLAHSKPTRNRLLLQVDRVQEEVNRRLRHFIDNRYRQLLLTFIANRYLSLAAFLALLILCVGLVSGGLVRVIVSPHQPGEFLSAELRMSEGSPEERTAEATRRIVEGMRTIDREHQRQTGSSESFIAHIAAHVYDRINGRIDVELTKQDKREISNAEIQRLWREQVGHIHGADVLGFKTSDGPEFGPNVAFDLEHNDFETLRAAAAELEEHLRHYDGLSDIRNGASDSRDEYHFELLPEGEALGLTRLDLGTQVRNAFYGAEAQRIQRGFDEVKVMVRYPQRDRESVESLDNMYIRTPDGDSVPLDTVARVEVKPGLLKSTRIDFQRAAEVTAVADIEVVEPSRVIGDLENNFLPQLREKYPGLHWNKAGLAEEERLLMTSLFIGFGLSLFGIYALLAIPTRSYLQPLIIMGVIPFGIIGAVVGHWVLDYALGMMSFIGIVALSGVVVNDSLILVDYINRAVAEGVALGEAIVEAACKRFRAIMLTSLTTFLGLAPMLMERSAQAQAMIPMAISLAFGIVFATVITLVLVPSLYLILDDLGRWWRGERVVRPAAETY
ncbi:efflux RND transporter permease subunit [Mangrovimicrobium sediminis]|uniref:Efflux RND transporter permease subunit n=2 Tax=Mangrovimicrobium sediminis TaxID=2562682 RepID=A0A4Z0LXZ0_9GAMM|nr:efflux RND transporter permease subunit [Haliea sp. SAOS-164]